MKSIFLTLFLMGSFSLNGMESLDVEPWKVHSCLRYSQTYVGETRICVAKGHVSKADAIADIIVGSKISGLENKKMLITPATITMHFDIRYGRYSFDYEKGRHKEGIIKEHCHCGLGIDDSNLLIDAEKNPEEVKKSLEWIYQQALSHIKKDHPNVRRIALSSLGTERGFPVEMVIPVAVKTISEFIKANPHAYAEILLFVNKQSLVTEYLECIEKFKKYLEYRELFE